MADYNQSVPQQPALRPPPFQFSEATRESTRAPVREDVSVTFGLVMLAGLVVGVFFLAVAVGVLRAAHAKADLLIVICWFFAWWSIGAASAFIFLAENVWKKLAGFRTTETIKGPAAQAAPAVYRTHYELHREPNSWVQDDLHCRPEQLIGWCRAADQGRTLAINGPMKKVFADPVGHNGREHYQEFLNQLHARGLVEDRGGNIGWRPTDPEGWAFVKSMLEAAEPTPLLAQESQNDSQG